MHTDHGRQLQREHREPATRVLLLHACDAPVDVDLDHDVRLRPPERGRHQRRRLTEQVIRGLHADHNEVGCERAEGVGERERCATRVVRVKLAGVGGIGLKGAFALGFAMALIATPCTGPALVALLAWIGNTGNVGLGAGAMFLYALGLGTLFWVVGTFAVGPNVLNDGAVLMSEQTMAEVFGAWWSDRPAFIAVKLAPDADVQAVRQQLNSALVGRGEAITKDDFEQRERLYWSRETPVGYITDLGFVMGVMIGMVFIYYAQYQIIRFYLPEYAILKSLGYGWWFFFFMIGQIGAAIITPAFVVAFTLARVVYVGTEAAMHLGMTMGLREMGVALVACIVMTLVSSLFAIRRLWKVDPIMLFE